MERAQCHWEFRQLLDGLFLMQRYAQRMRELQTLGKELQRARLIFGIDVWKLMIKLNQQDRLALGHFVQRAEHQSLILWQCYTQHKAQARLASAAAAAWQCSVMLKALHHLQHNARYTRGPSWSSSTTSSAATPTNSTLGNSLLTTRASVIDSQLRSSMQAQLAIRLAEMKDSPRKTVSYEEFVRQRNVRMARKH